MVDRIVPGDHRRGPRRASRRGSASRTPGRSSPSRSRQWVIEDRFPRRPARLRTAGAEFVADVAPYENMKLRLLNGSHSTLAYLGYLAGYETVADTMTDPDFARLVEA